MHSRILKSAGLVLASACLAFLSTGCKKIVPVTLTCNASAPSIYPGDQETVSATPANLVEKKNWDALYTWSGTGVSGSGTSATVATASLDPGSYTVKAEVKEGQKRQGRDQARRNGRLLGRLHREALRAAHPQLLGQP